MKFKGTPKEFIYTFSGFGSHRKQEEVGQFNRFGYMTVTNKEHIEKMKKKFPIVPEKKGK